MRSGFKMRQSASEGGGLVAHPRGGVLGPGLGYEGEGTMDESLEDELGGGAARLVFGNANSSSVNSLGTSPGGRAGEIEVRIRYIHLPIYVSFPTLSVLHVLFAFRAGYQRNVSMLCTTVFVYSSRRSSPTTTRLVLYLVYVFPVPPTPSPAKQAHHESAAKCLLLSLLCLYGVGRFCLPCSMVKRPET